MVGGPVLYDDSRVKVRLLPPRLGENNREIPGKLLRYDGDQIFGLEKDGLI